MLSGQALFFAGLGGFLPALFWLWFWFREDTIHPEPRGLIAFTFFAGMCAALLSLPLERLTGAYLGFGTLRTLIVWVSIEELFKYGAAHIAALRRESTNEPIDPLMYLITAALGFAAVENMFFLLEPVLAGNLFDSILLGNLRFIGASLLHTTASASIGVMLALSFYSSLWKKRAAKVCGVILAITLHVLFNFFIMKDDGSNTFIVFAVVWMGVICLFIAFEKVKSIHPIQYTSYDQR